MSSADSYNCAGGYICDSGSQQAADDGDLCEVGYECASGAFHAMECPDGYYADMVGLSACLTCPEGYYCNSNSTIDDEDGTKVLCEDYRQCGGGNAYQYNCDPGYYEDSDGDCIICEAGRYCLGGVEAGECTAGVACPEGQAHPEPWQYMCEVGRYCPHGTIYGLPCPAGTNSTQVGAMQATDCTACQPGYICSRLPTVSDVLCPPGYYCELYSFEATPCPLGTYSNETGLFTRE